MFLDELPVSYVIYTEEAQVKTIVGIELQDRHWDHANGANMHFGLLPVFMGGHQSLTELLEVLPEEHITNALNSISEQLANYVNDPSDQHANELIEAYKQLENGEEGLDAGSAES